MKLYNFLLLSFFSLVFLTGCDNKIVIEKYSETLEQGVYAVADSLTNGRVDLAESYINNVEKIVPVPKNRILITPVIKDGIRYIVINDREKNSKVIIVGSKDFNDLLKLKVINQSQQDQANQFAQQASEQAKKDADALNQLVVENKKLNDEIVQQDKIIQEYHNSLEYKVKSFIHWIVIGSFFGIPFLGIALVALCIFFPPAIPVVLQIFGAVTGVIWNILKTIGILLNDGLSLISSLLTSFSKSKPVVVETPASVVIPPSIVTPVSSSIENKKP
jgi:hypothetical protein